ncbi:TPA: hypothetical protein EYO12_03100 [Candidatus Saccharibacteria bacterium]|nr:hypothetical protein [Candidatus Saccharibacteria bacterium]HIO87979.1 hypothetical protein [Candidatus Saccharibacteria bacterium]
MINLLPPDYKEQIKYSRYNITMVGYVVLVFLVGLAMSAILFGSSLIAQKQLNDLDAQITDQQQLINNFDAVLQEAKELDAKIEKAGEVIANESNFIGFLEELEGVIPDFARIASISLSHASQTTGPDAPEEDLLQLTMAVSSRDQVATLQKTLETMQRVESIDVQAVRQDENDTSQFTVDMLLKLTSRPGERLEVAE